ncbi:cupin domain-containing protein [Actinotalea sp. Marseille-Q4924]|uniref:cupin domain-containing protein n=1 Tax=Actinotalea sp. Marseille-Q4924 TaxID=2866571 RepID=UPI001CE3E08B|nr:cupin domain-containing protein [Actinotalea sp. Marseille-Q4924]
MSAGLETAYDADAPLVPRPPRPEAVGDAEWIANLSEPARYGGEGPDRSREERATTSDGAAAHRFREILLETQDLQWVDKTLAGLSHKTLWRNEDTGASITLVRFMAGSGIPDRHSHASNQFMFCLSGRYTYLPTAVTLTAGSFYWNPRGSLHGPTLAEEETVLLEVYDGPHYPTQPSWYTNPDDAR